MHKDEIEINLNKILDGYPLMYHLGSGKIVDINNPEQIYLLNIKIDDLDYNSSENIVFVGNKNGWGENE